MDTIKLGDFENLFFEYLNYDLRLDENDQQNVCFFMLFNSTAKYSYITFVLFQVRKRKLPRPLCLLQEFDTNQNQSGLHEQVLHVHDECHNPYKYGFHYGMFDTSSRAQLNNFP